MSTLDTRLSRRDLLGLLTAGAAGVVLGELAPASAAAPGKAITIRYAHTASLTHPSHIWGTKFAEVVEMTTNGAVKVQIFPSAQLGKDPEVAGQILAGTIEMMNTGNSLWSQWVPAANIMDMPYLFNGLDHMYKFQDGPASQEISKLYQEKGFRILGWADIGIRHITNNKRPIEKPADLRGLKMRVVPSKTFVELFKALGATVVSMDFSELYSALQQGVVDGQDNPTTTIQSANFQEVQKYLSLTGHVVGTNPSVVGENFYSQLPADIQKALVAAGAEATKANRAFVKANETKALEFLKSKGMVVNTPDQAPFRAATASVYETLKEFAPPPLLATIRGAA